MSRRYLAPVLTPTEAEVARLQGLERGASVDDEYVRDMTADRLFNRLLSLTEQAESAQAGADERRAASIRRQVAKLRKEVQRRQRVGER